ncbi:MerR family transcriptional regulator [Caproiciproducens faecalis]|uniref:Helix-turn-helix domain-containing protein n=1 Tax=Caproiciproducens faecalis TaxID=2820301 RepID=A0ABS7DMU1_9FIRM|nr:helix-turn-helix domain-containing protein [Caproiciproducens faecalis]MBW7572429.1 helix-turn-helix domain-containing protein [Caproiciproducens faecalis]MBW7572468.1 helix-turn-helix domain-containing protein [Caproiciproducens faecalis]
MPRLRTLTETYNYIKEQDNETAITPNALRRMVVSGQIPCVKAGKKYLIDLDVLFEYLKGTKPEDVLPGYKNPLKIIQ